MIWCVEDDASIRDIELYALTSTGFEARGFDDGASFWEALQTETPELVLLDVMLPGEDGVSLLKKMKAVPALRDIPVIMATAKGAEYDKIRGLDLGADYYPEAGNERYKTEVLLVDADGLGEDDDAPDKTELEARLAAKRIRALLDEGFPVTDKQTGKLRPVTPGDIVILLRSPRNKAPTYIAELERIGVTASAEQRGGLLETAEVGTMVSLLSVIDNPRQDVDLIGVMRSPLFGFTEQELADIRLVDRKISYYDALLRNLSAAAGLSAHLCVRSAGVPPAVGDLRSDRCARPVWRAAERRTAPEQPADVFRAGALVRGTGLPRPV